MKIPEAFQERNSIFCVKCQKVADDVIMSHDPVLDRFTITAFCHDDAETQVITRTLAMEGAHLTFHAFGDNAND